MGIPTPVLGWVGADVARPARRGSYPLRGKWRRADLASVSTSEVCEFRMNLIYQGVGVSPFIGTEGYGVRYYKA